MANVRPRTGVRTRPGNRRRSAPQDIATARRQSQSLDMLGAPRGSIPSTTRERGISPSIRIAAVRTGSSAGANLVAEILSRTQLSASLSFSLGLSRLYLRCCYVKVMIHNCTYTIANDPCRPTLHGPQLPDWPALQLAEYSRSIAPLRRCTHRGSRPRAA